MEFSRLLRIPARLVVYVFCLNFLLIAVSGPLAPRIYSLHIKSDIKYRFATTLVTSRVANPAEVDQEVEFHVVLPNEAFISNFTMEIDGQTYPGEIKEKEKAKKQYEVAKKKGQSAGHIATRPRETNKFSVQVNVASLSKVTFNLTYQELLKRQRGLYEHAIYIDPGQVVNDLKVEVAIQESKTITILNVLPLRNDLLTDVDIISQNDIAIVEKRTLTTAYIMYNPSEEEQQVRSRQGLSGQFVVNYDLERQLDAGEVLVVNGYFVHFFAPRGMNPIPKDVLLILDKSGSMGGNKMEQLKDAMYRVLDDLHEGDRFNAIIFDDDLSYMNHYGMVPATRSKVGSAKEYIRRINAGGGTNINAAVTTGLHYLNDLDDNEGRSSIIVFLTDGRPSSGVTRIDTILRNVKRLNFRNIPVFSLAFGSGADYEFVKKVAVQNGGVGRRIFEDSDAALQIAGFYDEISNAILKNVSFQYLDDKVDNDTLTKSSFNMFFEGGEMVVAGKLENRNLNVLSLAVSGKGANGLVELNFVARVDETGSANSFNKMTKPEDYAKITEKIWAYLTIKQLLEKSVGETDSDEQSRIKARIIELSLKYNFVTPLTSMVVTKPDSSELGDMEEEDRIVGAPPSGQRSGQVTNQGVGGGGYSSGGGGGGDPHFMIKVKGMTEAICFDIQSKPNEVYQMLKDPDSKIEINARIINGHKWNKNDGHLKTFIGEIVVISENFWLEVTPQKILVNGEDVMWNTSNSIIITGGTISVRKQSRILEIQFDENVKVIIKRHIHNDTAKVDFLNFFLDKEQLLSKRSDGIIGEFAKKKFHLRRKLQKNGKVYGHLRIKEPGRKRSHFKANLVTRNDLIEHLVHSCWSVHRKTDRLLDHPAEYYLVKDKYTL